MAPDFSKKTVDTLAKRAAYLCSNPDCRASTVGPNSEAAIATVIGEAAHIYAARPDQPRYNIDMTDQARSEISNAIWLCGNCHTQIDRDPRKFPAELLYIWRERHDEYVASSLGSQSDKVRFELARDALLQFDSYPPVIRRIAFDKSPAWEWSLTAALMRYLNAPLFRTLDDIREGVRPVQIEPLNDIEVLPWVSARVDEMGEMVDPLAKIINRFNKAWGAHGQPGDIDEIHHTTLLLRDSLRQIVAHEERLNAVREPPLFIRTIELLRDALGSQADKLRKVPDRLDELVELAVSGDHEGTPENPKVVHETIEFTLPDDWTDNLSLELKRATKALTRHSASATPARSESGCTALTIVVIIAIAIYIFR